MPGNEGEVGCAFVGSGVCLRLTVPWCVRDVGHTNGADHTRRRSIGGEIAAGRASKVAERQRTADDKRITDDGPQRENAAEDVRTARATGRPREWPSRPGWRGPGGGFGLGAAAVTRTSRLVPYRHLTEPLAVVVLVVPGLTE